MTTREFRQITPTDHFGWHEAYLFAYKRLFEPLLNEEGAVCEIGTDGGGGILMYADYFERYGNFVRKYIACDIAPRPNGLELNPKVIHHQMDAYNPHNVEKIRSYAPLALCIDDGSHSISAQILFCALYPPLLSQNGLCIVEDVQSIDHIARLATAVPEGFYSFAIDLRHYGRYDNILFVIQRR